MFYSYFDELCKQKGVSVNKACKEMGVTRSVAAKWKNTNTSPRLDTLVKISDYFNVSIDTLLEHSGKKISENEKTATQMDDGRESIKAELMDYLDKLPFDDLVRLRDFLLSRQQ